MIWSLCLAGIQPAAAAQRLTMCARSRACINVAEKSDRASPILHAFQCDATAILAPKKLLDYSACLDTERQMMRMAGGLPVARPRSVPWRVRPKVCCGQPFFLTLCSTNGSPITLPLKRQSSSPASPPMAEPAALARQIICCSDESERLS